MKKINCYDCIHNGVCYLQEVTNDIEEQLEEFGCENYKSTTNFVEIVRCEECKHRGRWRCPMFTLAYNERIDKYVGTNNTEDDGFCYRGEKRIENE